MKYSPIDEVVASCYSILKGKGAKREDRPLIKFWIWLAEKQIGCAKPNQKVEEIDVENLTVRKPEDHLRTIDISLIDDQGQDRTYNYRGYNKRIHDKSVYNQSYEIDVYEDAFSIFLSSDADYIDRVRIKYWAYPVDSNCNPLIPEEHIYAIMRFCSFMYAEANSQSQSEIQRLGTEWKLQASKARAKNKMPDIPEAREILKGWMSLIPKQSDLDYETY